MIGAAQIAEALGARANGHGWMAKCVAHEDTTPSLSITEGAGGKVLVRCHAGCTQDAVISALRDRKLWPEAATTDSGITVAELAAAKELPEALLRESGFSDDEVKGYPVIRIEYRDAARVVLCTRYRGRIAKDGGARFWFHKGDKQQLFGLWRLKASDQDVIIVEGETDAVALWAAGFNAIGVPGAKAWNEKRFAPALKDCPTIYVHLEPDEGGAEFRAAFERSMLKERVRFFTTAPSAKDPCELRARDSAGFRAAIEALLREAKLQPAPLPPPEPTGFTDTDIANGMRLAKQHGADLHFTPERGWFVWDGRRWAADEKDVAVQGRAKKTALAIFDEVKQSTDREALFQHAQRSQQKRAVEAMIWMARSEPGIPTSLLVFDANPWLLNVANGTLNLRTGALRPHRRENLITRLVDVPYDPQAACPLWEAFLRRVTGSPQEGEPGALYTYLQRFVGYALTGDTSEQVLHFLHGGGQNGKTVFSETVQALLGDYAIVVSPEMVMVHKHRSIPNDIARLRGVRLAIMNETSQGNRFDEAKLKDLTGEDSLSGRFLHHEFFDFPPTHKLVIRGNHKPVINGTDEAIWRRLRLIPFGVYIPESERDKELIYKLKQELPGILRWAVEGCLEWHRGGLTPPDIVTEAVQQYRDESDTLGRFIAEHCDVRELNQVKAQALFTAYQQFCQHGGERWLSAKDFPTAMQGRAFERKRTKTCFMYYGLALTAASEAHWSETEKADEDIPF